MKLLMQSKMKSEKRLEPEQLLKAMEKLAPYVIEEDIKLLKELAKH